MKGICPSASQIGGSRLFISSSCAGSKGWLAVGDLGTNEERLEVAVRHRQLRIGQLELVRPLAHTRLEILVETQNGLLCLAQLAVLGAQMPDLEPTLQHRQHRLQTKRLLDVIERPGLHRLDCRVDGAVARHHDRDELRIDAPCRGEKLDAIEARHLQVRQQQVERTALQFSQRGKG